MSKKTFIVSLMVVMALSAFALITGERADAKYFGTMCQRDFQNGWQGTLPWQWNRCGGFNNELDDTDTKLFYYNLHGAKYWIENTGDQYYPEKADLFYIGTHGGAWTSDAVWAMWNQDQLAISSRMRLGDESRGLSILASYACKTHKMNDGRTWARWDSIFRGGLRWTGGSHGTVYDWYTTDETGEDFADLIQRGYTLKYSWKDANSDWLVANDIAVLSVGTNSSDCWNRLNYMRWTNITNWTRLRDGQIGYWCGYYWDNL